MTTEDFYILTSLLGVLAVVAMLHLTEEPMTEKASRKRVVEVRTPRAAFTQDQRKMPHDTKPFLGLYEANGKKEVYIIWRARKPEAGLNFLTNEGSQHPHYLTDPIAWADIPDYEHIP